MTGTTIGITPAVSDALAEKQLEHGAVSVDDTMRVLFDLERRDDARHGRRKSGASDDGLIRVKVSDEVHEAIKAEKKELGAVTIDETIRVILDIPSRREWPVDYSNNADA